MGFCIIMIRQLWDCLIFIMGIPKLVRRYLSIETPHVDARLIPLTWPTRGQCTKFLFSIFPVKNQRSNLANSRVTHCNHKFSSNQTIGWELGKNHADLILNCFLLCDHTTIQTAILSRWEILVNLHWTGSLSMQIVSRDMGNPCWVEFIFGKCRSTLAFSIFYIYIPAIHLHGKQRFIFSAKSIPWLLMTWWHKKPGHQQPW